MLKLKFYLAIGDLVVFNEIIGFGAFGSVYRAEYKGEVCAAKILKDAANQLMFPTQEPIRDKESKAILKECSFLEKLKHENVIQHITTAIEPRSGSQILVMELMDCSLNKFIPEHRPLDLSLQLTICHGVSSGLHYLHSNDIMRIIHRDLCGDNILLTLPPEVKVKITDFGMSTILDKSVCATFSAVHRKGYLPPEATSDDDFDDDDDSDEETEGKKALHSYHFDIFSLGAVATQTVRSANPFKDKQALEQTFKTIPEDHPLKGIIAECLREDPKQRPQAKVVCEHIAALK